MGYNPVTPGKVLWQGRTLPRSFTWTRGLVRKLQSQRTLAAVRSLLSSQSVSHYQTPTSGAYGPLYTLGL